MTMLTHPLIIPRYAAAVVPVIPVDSPGQWSGFFLASQLCKVLLNKTGTSQLAQVQLFIIKNQRGDCLNPRTALTFMATHVRTCDLREEERRSFALRLP